MDISESNVVLSLKIPFKTTKEAEIVYNCFSIDQEPKRGGVIKSVTVKDDDLNVKFIAKEAKKVRTAVKSFISHLLLVINTIQQFELAVLK